MFQISLGNAQIFSGQSITVNASLGKEQWEIAGAYRQGGIHKQADTTRKFKLPSMMVVRW
jgi:hypothetical protein